MFLILVILQVSSRAFNEPGTSTSDPVVVIDRKYGAEG
jgi:hypothetical protein